MPSYSIKQKNNRSTLSPEIMPEELSSTVSDFTDFSLRYPRTKSIQLYTDFLKESKSFGKKSRKQIRKAYQNISHQTSLVEKKFHLKRYFDATIEYVQKNGARILVSILIVDVILLFFFFLYLYTPLSASQADIIHSHLVEKAYADDASIVSKTIPAGETGIFASYLQSEGFAVSAGYQTRKNGLTVPGAVVTAGNDTMLVFEYPNSRTASSEASSLSQTYAKKCRCYVGRPSAHLHKE